MRKGIKSALTILSLPHNTAVGQDLEAGPGHDGHLLARGLCLRVPALPAVVVQTTQPIQQVHQPASDQALLLRSRTGNKC